jgi:hypothetical protein
MHGQDHALSFNGASDYVSFGDDTLYLGLRQFTLELWFYREGPGLPTSTGPSGLADAIPLLAKGRGAGMGDRRDMNYFLGIRASDSVLVADYVEGEGQAEPGLNHPVIGVTPIREDTWYHAAVTFDGTDLRLFLNGNLEAEVTGLSGRLPRWDSGLETCLATAMDTLGLPEGFFEGIIDEARVWSRARTQQAIVDSMGIEFASAPELNGRWDLNEGVDTIAHNSVTGSPDGALEGSPSWVAGSPFALTSALALGASQAYVTFGNTLQLALPQFTIETWFRRDGDGITATTGDSGVVAIPLIAKGCDQGDGGVWDVNYFLGIRGSDSLLCADFEEGSGGAMPGRNHPVIGTTPIERGIWHHAAATYDGTTLRLYLDGVLENELVVGQPAQSQSVQHASLGAALDTAGIVSGHFDGVLDEVRVWNTARTESQIQLMINEEIDGPAVHLVARWGMNEGAGVTVSDAAGGAIDGAIVNGGWAWVDSAPFDLTINNRPYAPVPYSPFNGATNVTLSPTLDAAVSDPEGDSLTVTFHGRPLNSSGAPDPFSVIVLPPAKNYTMEPNDFNMLTFSAQMVWIVNNISTLNIAFAHQTGDITAHGELYHVEWERAGACMHMLEDTATTHRPPEGLPYSVSIGDCDETPQGDPYGVPLGYADYFGYCHFHLISYWGGHYGLVPHNSFSFFSASGLDFIVITLKYGDPITRPEVLSWADSLLKAYPTRRGIVCSHSLIETGDPGAWTPAGQAVYDSLKSNPNLFLMLCGDAIGEGRRSDTFNGHTVLTLLANYEDRPHGEDGWLRILTFYPEENVLRVKTYSPTLDSLEADPDSSSQFTLACDLRPIDGWRTIGTVCAVPSGSHATIPWPGRGTSTEYEWYAIASDGTHSTVGPMSYFTTHGTIPVVHVDYPNGREKLVVGSTITLRYRAEDAQAVSYVHFYISRNGPSGDYVPIATYMPNTGVFEWTVTEPATTDAYLMVQAYDTDGGMGSDTSDAAFEIDVMSGVEGHGIPRLEFEMSSAHPFQGAGAFDLAIPNQTNVRMNVYDVSGRLVAVIADGWYQPGRYRVTWNGNTPRGKAASGVYFVKLQACGKTMARKVVLVR